MDPIDSPALFPSVQTNARCSAAFMCFENYVTHTVVQLSCVLKTMLHVHVQFPHTCTCTHHNVGSSEVVTTLFHLSRIVFKIKLTLYTYMYMSNKSTHSMCELLGRYLQPWARQIPPAMG